MDVRSCLLQVSQVSGCGCEELFATSHCEHARFCVEGFYALYINFHSFIQVSQVSGCGCEELFATSQSSE